MLAIQCIALSFLLGSCLAASADPNNHFIYPPPEGGNSPTMTWHVNDVVNLTWTTEFKAIDLILWSNDQLPDGTSFFKAILGEILCQATASHTDRPDPLLIHGAAHSPVNGNNSYSWVVDKTGATGSGYHLNVIEWNATANQQTSNGFNSLGFNIVDAPFSTNGPSSTTTSGSTDTASPTSGPSTSPAISNTGPATTATSMLAPTAPATLPPAPPIGLGVGLGVGLGIPLIVAAIALVWLYRRWAATGGGGTGPGIESEQRPMAWAHRAS